MLFTRNRSRLLLASILVIALLLRAWGLVYDLPYIYSADEPVNISTSQQIFKTGDWNPHRFDYPSLFLYLNALAYWPYYLVANLLGITPARHDILDPIVLAMGVTRAPMPSTVVLGRVLTLCFGMGTVALAFLAGRRVSGIPAVGLLASLMVATSPTTVKHSRLITPDTFATFFALASLLASTLVSSTGKPWHYALSGFCVGLTASSKYNGILVAIVLVVAHFLRRGRKGFLHYGLPLAGFSCVVGFLLATPYAVLDSRSFLDAVRFDVSHYSTGHAGMEGESLRWYLSYMWKTGSVVYILAAAGILYGAIARKKAMGYIAAFPVTYVAFISSFTVRTDCTCLPAAPFLFILSSWFIVQLSDGLRRVKRQTVRSLCLAGLASLGTVALALPMLRTVADIQRLQTVDSRQSARIWIEKNLAHGAKIAIESYSPFVEPSLYEVTGLGKLIDHSPEWYVEKGYDYLVFGEAMYGRFFLEPDRYAAQVSQYELLFRRFPLMVLFNDGDYEVRVYKVD